MAIFTDVFDDVTKQGRKIPTSEYRESGAYPIIDQGQSVVAGYTDETDGLFTDVPAIIFGDHTRVLKYVDTPCFLGADGVKLLKAKIANPNYKYLYYVLSNANIPNTGYNRHFKWLKEVDIPLPDADEQQKNVNTLDKISELIALRKEQLAKLDQLVKSRFIELFGNRGENPYNFPTTTMGEIYKFQYGKGNNIPEDKGEYPCYGSNGVVGHHTEYNSEDSPIIGHIGAYAGIVNWGKGKHYVTYNGVICKLINNQVNPVYGYHLLQIQDYNTVAKSGAAQPFVSYKDLDAPVVNIPPLEQQNQFAVFVEQTDKSKLAIQQSLDKLELLKKSLMQEYFG